MRRAVRRLCQRPHDGAARQIDLEGVVRVAFGVAQQCVGRSHKRFALRTLPAQRRFYAKIAPWLVGDASQRQPRLFDCIAVELESSRHRHQGEGVGQAVADFQIGVVLGETLSGELNASDDLVRAQIGVALRRAGGQAMKIAERNGDSKMAARFGLEISILSKTLEPTK